MIDAVAKEVAAHLSSPVGVGKVIDGKYRVDALVGEGGMGVVWKATQLDLERPVAIKVVREEFASNEAVVSRTLREARAAAKLRGKHVVRVLDVGRLPSGAPYIVMEHLEGRDLYTDLAERLLPMPIAVAVDLVLEACEGLAEAHAVGIVHRDLKPENLFIAEQPDGSAVVKILDFGISKEICADAPQSTTTPTAIGSPQYMAPEQMRAASDTDARADIWSLGATLYELITGRPPFDATTIPEVCNLVLEGEVEPPRKFRPEMPLGLEAVVLRCLRKSRDERFATVSELAYALAAYGSPAADDRATRIARVLAGSQPRHSCPPAHWSEAPTLRESAFDDLSPSRDDAAQSGQMPVGLRWPAVALVSAVLAMPLGFGAATGVTTLHERLVRAAPGVTGSMESGATHAAAHLGVLPTLAGERERKERALALGDTVASTSRESAPMSGEPSALESSKASGELETELKPGADEGNWRGSEPREASPRASAATREALGPSER